ncbi:MAG: MGMT family protein [Bacteroidota bacterium]
MVSKLSINFFEAVYDVVRLVPSGRVTTYGAIASYLSSKGSARMVGWALHQVAQQEAIPAHRVVNRQGLLTGKHHFKGTHTMEQRLAAEGITTQKDRIQKFEELFWNPAEELTVPPLL